METKSTSPVPDEALPTEDDHLEMQDDTPDDHNNVITDKELTECDREPLHLIGHIQGDTGHTLFISNPEANIIGADANAAAIRLTYHILGRDEILLLLLLLLFLCIAGVT